MEQQNALQKLVEEFKKLVTLESTRVIEQVDRGNAAIIESVENAKLLIQTVNLQLTTIGDLVADNKAKIKKKVDPLEAVGSTIVFPVAASTNGVVTELPKSTIKFANKRNYFIAQYKSREAFRLKFTTDQRTAAMQLDPKVMAAKPDKRVDKEAVHAWESLSNDETKAFEVEFYYPAKLLAEGGGNPIVANAEPHTPV